MTRYKKFVKSEKAKTKLKGAKLQKGLNITKTDFKIKKIVIREQIKDITVIEDGAVIRSQNIKELLSKLQHHNATNRNEGLRYLKELVTNHPQEASKHLGAIIQGISQLCLDTEREVRRECYKALNVVLACQTPAIITPFFNTISSYLRCAMTHIHVQIQEDSLHMLDCLLLYMPSLVAANSDSIFSTFLDMISKLRIESKPERTLTINLNSKISSVKWRSKVLERLLGILKAILAEKNRDHQLDDADYGNNYVVQVEDSFKPRSSDNVATNHTKSYNLNVIFEPEKQFHYSLINRNLNKNCDLSSLFKSSIGAGGSLMEKNEGNRIRSYAELLLPLLFETWMEVRPASLNNTAKMNFADDDMHITNEAAFTLKTILEVIERLHELMALWDIEVNNTDLTDWFRKTYRKDFSTHFLNAFPYQQGDGFRGSKKKSKGAATEQEVYESGGSNCFQQNLGISCMFALLNHKLTRVQQESGEKVVKFLKSNIQHLDNQNQEVSFMLVKLLRIILITNGENWINSNLNVKDLLKSVLALYQSGKFSKDIRSKILILLCDIGLNARLCAVYGNNLFESWLATLPKMLCQSYISQHVLQTFLQLAKQQNTVFLKHLEMELPFIIQNIQNIQVSGFKDPLEGRKLIINLFYWLQNWNGPREIPTDCPDANKLNKHIQDIVILKGF